MSLYATPYSTKSPFTASLTGFNISNDIDYKKLFEDLGYKVKFGKNSYD